MAQSKGSRGSRKTSKAEDLFVRGRNWDGATARVRAGNMDDITASPRAVETR